MPLHNVLLTHHDNDADADIKCTGDATDLQDWQNELLKKLVGNK